MIFYAVKGSGNTRGNSAVDSGCFTYRFSEKTSFIVDFIHAADIRRFLALVCLSCKWVRCDSCPCCACCSCFQYYLLVKWACCFRWIVAWVFFVFTIILLQFLFLCITSLYCISSKVFWIHCSVCTIPGKLFSSCLHNGAKDTSVKAKDFNDKAKDLTFKAKDLTVKRTAKDTKNQQ